MVSLGYKVSMPIEIMQEYNESLSMQVHFTSLYEKEKFVTDFLLWRELKGVLPRKRNKKSATTSMLHEMAHMLWVGQEDRSYKDILKETSILLKFFKSFLMSQTSPVIVEEIIETHSNNDSQHRFFTEPHYPTEREAEFGQERTNEAHSSASNAIL